MFEAILTNCKIDMASFQNKKKKKHTKNFKRQLCVTENIIYLNFVSLSLEGILNTKYKFS